MGLVTHGLKENKYHFISYDEFCKRLDSMNPAVTNLNTVYEEYNI